MKLGLVLEGGASRACFTNGVMDVLLEEGIRADYVVGVSAGIGNAISYVAGQHRRNWRITSRLMDERYMGKKHLLRKDNRSYYNIDFVFNQIPNHLEPFNYEAFGAFDGDVLAGVTDLESGEVEFLPLDTEDRHWRKLVASCSLPLLFPPVEMDDKLYMDGGIACPIPFAKALRDGCDRVIVVLTRDRDYEKKVFDPLNELAADRYAAYPKFAEALRRRNRLYNAQRKVLFELEARGKVFIIAPEDAPRIKRTERDPEKLKALYCHGCHCTRQLLPELRDYLEIEDREQ